MQEGYYGLAIVGVLTSVVSVFYYLRIVVSMFMTDAPAEAVPSRLTTVGYVGALAAALVVLYLGVLPSRVIELATQSIDTIF